MRPIELSGLTSAQLDELERTAPLGWKISRIDITDPAGRLPPVPLGYLQIPEDAAHALPVKGLVEWLRAALLV